MKEKMSTFTKTILAAVTAFSLASCAVSASAEKAPETAPVSDSEQGGEEEAKTGKKVYFAAPMFAAFEKEYNLKIVKILEDHGYEVFLPQRDGLEAALLEGKTDEEKTQIIFEKDITNIENADIVFMLVDGRVPDEGACVELGYAYAINKRCYGFKTDTRSIELDLDLNPLIAGCFIKLFKDYDGDKLLKELDEYLSENDL